MKTRYGTPYWTLRSGRAPRPAHPRHRGHLETDVVIVGAGVTGCAIAYAFAAAGVKVAVFEADRVAGGSTASSSGLLLQDPPASFRDLAELHGVRTARAIYQATRRAALDFGTTLRRLGIRCDFEPRASVQAAMSPDAAKMLAREAAARREAGLDAVWLNARRLRSEMAIDAQGGILRHGDAQLDPVRACLGLARAAAGRGAAFYERTLVRRVRFARRWADVTTAGGTARAQTVIVATNAPGDAYRQLKRHFKPWHSYMVATEPLPAAARRETGRERAILRDTESPPHYLGWSKDDRVLFGGADQPAIADRARPKTLVQRTGQLMYELSRIYPAISGLMPEYGWDAPYAVTPDGAPFIGAHRNLPRHLFALGCGPHGLASSFLAGRLLLRAYLDESAKGDDAFSFARILG